jgi:hypothetical protein
MTEEVSFHNSFVKQIKAWINETKNKGKKSKPSSRLSSRLSYLSSATRTDGLDACLIPRWICDKYDKEPDKMRNLLKSAQRSAIMIAESYSKRERREMPESLRNKIIMFKL